MEHMGLEDQVSMTVYDSEIVDYDSEIDDSACSSPDRFGFFTSNGMKRVDEGNREHQIIKRTFLNGLGVFAKDTNVVAIHKNSYSSLTGQARRETFRIFSDAVAKKSGSSDANIKYAWYGASRDEICEIVTHGFSRIKKQENSESFGFGVSLSPANFTVDGALSSVLDENGMRHLLLCRVILGNTEEVSAGSGQFQPSSKEFDSGVDNLSSPRRYIIWSAYMNSHIFPNYIVSFRALKCATGSERNWRSIVIPKSPYMKFPTLLSMISSFLPRSKMAVITKYHTEYKEKKLSRVELIQVLRQLAGDKLLMAMIKYYRTKQLGGKN